MLLEYWIGSDRGRRRGPCEAVGARWNHAEVATRLGGSRPRYCRTRAAVGAALAAYDTLRAEVDRA